MTLTILGSESSGNCYILKSDTGTLILEAGIRLDAVKKALNFDLSSVAGCLISHSHLDHCKYADSYAKTGINIYASQETIDAYKPTYRHRFHALLEGVMAQLGSFRIIPFDVPHGGISCYGYLITHPESGKILFVTDCAYIPGRFIGLSQVLIEANYEDAILTSDRAVGKHMSIDTTVAFLKANDLSKVQNIVLLHLSSSNSNAKAFAKAVIEVAPNASVLVGDKGLEIELNKYPF